MFFWENKELLQRLTPFAQARKGKLSFAWVDADKFAGHVENLGIPVNHYLVIWVQISLAVKLLGTVFRNKKLSKCDMPSLGMEGPTTSYPQNGIQKDFNIIYGGGIWRAF